MLNDPNRWQRLEFSSSFVDQSGVASSEYPPFTGPQWGFVKPFALSFADAHYNNTNQFDGVYFNPPPVSIFSQSLFDFFTTNCGVVIQPPLIGLGGNDSLYQMNFTVVAQLSGFLDATQPVHWSASPANATLGANNPAPTESPADCAIGTDVACRNRGTGHRFNPMTGEAYAANDVLRGDYTRVLAEFWADGPDSETPPGHWNTIANYVTDQPTFVRRWRGLGRPLDRLEFDVKLYFLLNSALHDSAIAAWGIKVNKRNARRRHFTLSYLFCPSLLQFHHDFVRPITAIRWMATLGQSSNPNLPSFHPFGLPLVQGHIEVMSIFINIFALVMLIN